MNLAAYSSSSLKPVCFAETGRRPSAEVPAIQHQSEAAGPPRGLVGLFNLGNTCFMNSCLQCLSNVPYLTEYFLNGTHKKHINKKSPSRGAVAMSFGRLICNLWSRKKSGAEKPSELKKVIGQVASRFMGYEQHDAQEFLRFLLDALHDDLNLIRKRPPYVELTERPEDSDEVSWHTHCSMCSVLIILNTFRC